MRTLLTTMRGAAWAVLLMLTPSAVHAQGTSPWVDAVNELQTQFTGPIARGLSLIAIVVGGLMFAFGDSRPRSSRPSRSSPRARPPPSPPPSRAWTTTSPPQWRPGTSRAWRWR